MYAPYSSLAAGKRKNTPTKSAWGNFFMHNRHTISAFLSCTDFSMSYIICHLRYSTLLFFFFYLDAQASIGLPKIFEI